MRDFLSDEGLELLLLHILVDDGLLDLLELQNRSVFELVYLDVAILHPAQFEEGVLDHVLVDPRLIKLLHPFVDFLALQLLDVLNRDMVGFVFIEDMEERLDVVFRHFDLVFDVAYHCDDAVFEKLVVDVGFGELVEDIEDVRVVVLVGEQFYLLLHFLHLDREDDGHLFLDFVVIFVEGNVRADFFEFLSKFDFLVGVVI